MSKIRITTFRAEVTPPLGSPLCAGLITPVESVLDPLFALGVVLLGEEASIVLCALDWCEICNGDHVLWREGLAAAAQTTPDRVVIQCVHQHNTPLTDLQAQAWHREHSITPDLMDVPSFHAAIARTAEAIRASLPHAQPVTHVQTGRAEVKEVASNRRILDTEGKSKAIRWSKCVEPEVRAEPEGLIDPFLKTLSFWNGNQKLAALHYYAVHPMSYYGDGKVTADFVGLARERRTQEDKGAMHLYFTECAGNLTVGKYNNGSPENRPVLAERLYQAMLEAEQNAETSVPDRLEWRVCPLQFPPRQDFSAEELRQRIADTTLTMQARKLATIQLSFLHRTVAQIPTLLTALHLNDDICLLHLPGEAFVEYQLYAQALRPDAFVAVPSYGDLGMGYIPLEQSYIEGGYEVTWAFATPASEALMKQAIDRLVTCSSA